VFVVARNGRRQTVGIWCAQWFRQAGRRPQPRFRKYKKVAQSIEHFRLLPVLMLLMVMRFRE